MSGWPGSRTPPIRGRTVTDNKIIGPAADMAVIPSKLRELLAGNIRADVEGDDDELRQSMKQFGWIKEFSALADENGVVLVGNRRLRLAKELGIEPVITTLNFGNGDTADAER